jgi:S1-C subfamily serine protease
LEGTTVILNIRHLCGSLAGRGQRVALRDGQSIRLGRAPESDVRFSDETDDGVSNVHAVLCLEAGRLYVEDQNSSNGTFVDGEACPAHRKVVVPDGARLQLARQGPELAITLEAEPRPVKQGVGKETLMGEVSRLREEQQARLAAESSGRRKELYAVAAAVLAVLLLGVGGFALSERRTEETRLADAASWRQDLDRASNPWAEVERQVGPAVVHIRCVFRIRASNGTEMTFQAVAGSGVQIRPGVVLTARHVVEPWRFVLQGHDPDAPGWDELAEKYQLKAEYDTLEVQFPGQLPLQATLTSGQGPRTEDLALLRIQQTNAPSVDYGPTNADVEVTDDIAIIGYPGGLGQYAFVATNAAGSFSEMQEVVPTFMKGTVAQPLTGGGASRHLYFDASIEPGSSGGPVVDRDGRLIGIVSLQYNRPGDTLTIFGQSVQTYEPMEVGSAAVSPDDIHSFLRKHGIG